MKSIKLYNQLDGKTATRSKLEKLFSLSKTEHNTIVSKKIGALLEKYPDAKRFDVVIKNKVAITDVKNELKATQLKIAKESNTLRVKRNRLKKNTTSYQKIQQRIDDLDKQRDDIAELFGEKRAFTTKKLAAPRHKGIAKEALTECGRLKPGYKYVKGGKIEKIPKNKADDYVWVAKNIKETKKGERGIILTTYSHNDIIKYRVKLESNKIVDFPEDNFVGFKKKPENFKFKEEKKKINSKKNEIISKEKKYKPKSTSKKTKKNSQLALFGKAKKKNKKTKSAPINGLGSFYFEDITGKQVTQPLQAAVPQETIVTPVKNNVETTHTKIPSTTNTKKSAAKNASKYVQNLTEAKAQSANSIPFPLNGEMSQFLGNLEKKAEHSLVITLDAPAGAGKTRAAFQFIEMCINSGHNVFFGSLEEHPTSTLFQNKVAQYISPENISAIQVMADLPPTYQEFFNIIKQSDVIVIDSWNKVFETYKIDFDNDLRKALNGKLILCIFQRTSSGSMRGGSKSAFDGDIILEVVKDADFRNSYLQARKNRYQDTPLNEIGYNIFNQALINPEKLNAGVEYPSEATI